MTEWTDDGRPAVWVTEIEPEFDANERDSWYALDEFNRALCPDCGNLTAICSTPEGLHGEGFYLQRRICYATAAQKAGWRLYSRPYKNTEPGESGFHPLDGVVIWPSVTDLTPDDDFLNDQPEDLTPSDS